jgi:hypothetical protein
MELAPIPGIRGLVPQSAPKVEREVAAAFAADRLGRMEDDAYEGDGGSGQRGLEEEGEGALDSEGDDGEDFSSEGEVVNGISFFA